MLDLESETKLRFGGKHPLTFRFPRRSPADQNRYQQLAEDYCRPAREQLPLLAGLDVNASESTAGASEPGVSQADYKDICALGKGAYGTVVKAYKIKTGEVVAIKSFRNSQHLKQDVNILERLNHVSLALLITNL